MEFPRITESGEYRKACKLREDVKARLTEVETEIWNLPENLENTIEAEAAKLLGVDVQDREKLLHLREVLMRAIEMQDEVIETIRMRLSQEVCEPLKPTYFELLQNIVNHAVGLGQLLELEKTFRGSLAAADVDHEAFFPEIPDLNIGSLADSDSPISAFMKGLADAGYMPGEPSRESNLNASKGEDHERN